MATQPDAADIGRRVRLCGYDPETRTWRPICAVEENGNYVLRTSGDAAIGNQSDSAENDPQAEASLIALMKGCLTALVSIDNQLSAGIDVNVNGGL